MGFPVVRYFCKAQELKIESSEVLRYLGYKKELITEEDFSQAATFTKEALPFIKPAACWSRFKAQISLDGKIQLPYGSLLSRDLSRNLFGCTEIFIFAATIGLDFDRLVQRTKFTSMAKASFFNAIGAAAVEDLCDRLNADLSLAAQKEGKKLRPRYSPGYGDYNLENQKGIFELLNPSKIIGLNLKENLIMVPEKSVTALIGIEG